MVCYVVIGVDTIASVVVYLMFILMIDEVSICVNVRVGLGLRDGVGFTLLYTAVTCWVCFPSNSTYE